MAAINFILFEGNLGRDPELKKTDQGTPYCDFTMAQTIEKSIKGEKKEFTTWAHVTVWGKIAESLAKNLHKGRRVLVRGSFIIDDWIDREGKERKSFNITADGVNYLDEPTRRGADESSEKEWGSGEAKLETIETQPPKEPEIKQPWK